MHYIKQGNNAFSLYRASYVGQNVSAPLEPAYQSERAILHLAVKTQRPNKLSFIHFERSAMDNANLTLFYFSEENVTLTTSTVYSEPNTTESSKWMEFGILIIASSGTIGNTLSFLVFCQPYFAGTTTSIFLRFLAVFDSLTLWSYLIWDVSHYFHPEMNSVTYCRVLFWIQASLPHTASYILLAVTIERLLAVVRPLHVRLTFTRRRVFIIITVIIILPFCYNLAHFRLTTLNNPSDGGNNVCRYDPKLKEFADIWYYFDSIIGIIIPAVLIFIMNIITITAYNRAKRRQLKMTAQNSRAREKGNHLTIMLMAISLAYWVLMLPSAALFIAKVKYSDWFWANDANASLFTILFQSSYLLMITTNAIQFVLYLLTARKFANELLDVIRCKCTLRRTSSSKRNRQRTYDTIVFSSKGTESMEYV
ncbi:hypothetical protein CAPTEDRAFT_197699 [Capitella teleta]|uniref:G-protein coupled receptors family 1 profile domain-containing protein n=1 Tax=Capitella teleta TaxID=283909 RepID=R7VHK3_CAPTE|nr:hypothetical protein CAPTEDRAFT_197699 [Capitella teleta]|eukprot:ELU18057.1 hypothetical protein CAPTEDRAFT_197699 [Capitella teleta]